MFIVLYIFKSLPSEKPCGERDGKLCRECKFSVTGGYKIGGGFFIDLGDDESMWPFTDPHILFGCEGTRLDDEFGGSDEVDGYPDRIGEEGLWVKFDIDVDILAPEGRKREERF